MGIGESAFRLVDLQAGKAQIHEHRIHHVDVSIFKHMRELVEGGMHRNETFRQPFLFHAPGGECQRLDIPVDADQPSLGTRLEKRRGMSRKAERAIHCDCSRLRQCRCDQIHAFA